MACHAKSQLLYLLMIMLKVDSEYAGYILSMHTAKLLYTQPLNNCIYTPCEYSFERNPFCLRNLPFNKRLNSIYCKIFIYVHKNLSVPPTSDLLEILALTFLYNSHHEHFAKINNEKVILENQCDKKSVHFLGASASNLELAQVPWS